MVQSQSPLAESSEFSFVAAGGLSPFVASLSQDRRLAAVDIAGSIAHVAMLRSAGVLSHQEAKGIASALRSCLSEIETGEFPWRESLEDVHTNVEARVAALVGDPGAKIHAARSRNDQVALDERLYIRLAIEDVLDRIARLEAALIERAKGTVHVVVPAHTHLQQAQPAVLAHAFLAHVWRLARDADRLHDAFARVNVSPAGAAAVAGTSIPIDPQVAGHLLGFDRVFANSIDATGDRDYLIEVVSDLALLAVHLSGLAEDLVLWSTQEFSRIRLADAHVAGSSLLPNKRNPDAAELVRGRAGSVIGDLVALLATVKALPLGYHRDLQEGKGSAFHAFDTMAACLEVLTAVVADASLGDGAVAGTLSPELAAVLLVEDLVAQDVPYREAYDTVKAHLPEIAAAPTDADRLRALRKASPRFDAASLRLLTPDGAVSAVVSHGGTGPEQVAAQIDEAESALGRQVYQRNLIAKKNRRIADVLSGEAGQ